MNKKHMASYLDRAMKSRDPRFANLLGKLGYDVKEAVVEQSEKIVGKAAEVIVVDPVEELKNVRSQYEAVFGKKPYYGWSKDELLDRIAKAKNE